jgi:hypothetical protein
VVVVEPVAVAVNLHREIVVEVEDLAHPPAFLV